MKPILDSQICQIESDYKQYFSKMHTFKLFINQKNHYSFLSNYAIYKKAGYRNIPTAQSISYSTIIFPVHLNVLQILYMHLQLV